MGHAQLVQVRGRGQGPASVRRRDRSQVRTRSKDTKGTRTNIKELDESAKYSWVKSPRWKGHPVEVGPLARYLVAYARGNKEIQEQVNGALKALDVPITALFSTLGRTAARGLECQWAAHKMRYFYDQLVANIKAGDLATANVEKWEPSTWATEAKGVAPCEAPRGALAHWVKIKSGRIDSYQCVVPTTWNAGPRDAKGQIGPTRQRCSTRRWPSPTSRSRSCARSTASIRAWPARRT